MRDSPLVRSCLPPMLVHMSLPTALIASLVWCAIPVGADVVDVPAAESADVTNEREALLDRLIGAVDDLMGSPPPIVVEITSELWSLDDEGSIGEKMREDEQFLLRWADGLWTWDGPGALRLSDGVRMWTVSSRSRELAVGPNIDHQYATAFEVLLQREGFGGWAPVATLARELRECEVRSIVECDGVIRCEYTLPRAGVVMEHSWRHVVEVDMGPPTRLLEITSIVRDARSGSWNTSMRQVATEWMDVAGHPLPRVVDRFRPGAISLNRFIVQSARIAEPGEAATWTFAPPREPGWTVRDSRLRLEFVTGERIVTVAGRRYRLAEPLMEHPGDALAELLESAEVLDGATP